VRAGDRRAGVAGAHHPRADPLPRVRGARRQARVPGRGDGAAHRPPGCAVGENRPVALEFSARVQRITSYPVAGAYAGAAPPVRLASNESPEPPLPAVREAIERALGGLNRYPDPASTVLRERLSDRYEVPASRIAIG